MNKISTRDLVLEIGTEEIPSGYFEHILWLLSGKESAAIKDLFESQNIKFDSVFCYSTPRRIILHVRDIPTHQDVIIEGPPTRVAFDKEGKPTKALEAFLNNNKASLEGIEIFKGEKEEKVRFIKKNVSNKEILEAILPNVINSLDFPKTMRWDNKGLTFARPIRWILALFGNETLMFSLGGLVSSNITHGHRFLGKQRIKVKNTSVYFKILTRNKVIWNNEERRKRIETFLRRRNWHENRQLLDEVANIVEWPHFIEGVFKKEYLGIPKEVILASMSKHQRIFCLKDRKGELTNRFVAVLNGRYSGLRHIRSHYEDVLDARLKDAMFFYKADTAKPLSRWQEGLSGVIFHKQLGTIKDKTERIKEIASFLTKYIVISDDEKKHLARAAAFCKADLLTQMVKEFPSLQGVMGGYYALASGEDAEVAEAIGEHYLPRFSGDMVPETTLGAICSLADKLDNIMCYFKIGKFPKGNWDLYALRRQGIGIISILLKKQIFLSLPTAFDHIYDIAPGEYDKEKLKAIFADFFRERFVSFAKERFNYGYDLMESVIASGTDDIYNSFLKLESLNSIIGKIYFENARCITERTNNILRSSRAGVKEDIKQSLLRDKNEASLYNKFDSIKEDFKALCVDRKYAEATRLYGESLYDEVHNFFDKVLVNADDAGLKTNRLALLSAINRLYVDNIADLSKIVVVKT